jgi:hypothetical protein
MLTHPGTAESMRPLLEVSERAYDIAAEFWPGDQADRYVMIVPSTTEQLGRILHETVDLGKFVAFVGAGADRTNGWEPTGPRVFIHLSHLRRYNTAQQTEIIAHELLHAITRPISGPMTPTWIEEGLANLGAGGRIGPLGSGSADTFPTNDLFVTGSVQDIQASYARAQLAIVTIVDERGKDGLERFYSELGSRRVTAGTDEYHVRDAIADSGWSYGAWLDAWRERLD